MEKKLKRKINKTENEINQSRMDLTPLFFREESN
jgi:hypothetical protein